MFTYWLCLRSYANEMVNDRTLLLKHIEKSSSRVILIKQRGPKRTAHNGNGALKPVKSGKSCNDLQFQSNL